jgi:magnesium transporter
MTTEFISLRKEMTVAQAMEKVRRQAADMETIYTLYVTDNTRKLEGVLSLKELVCAEPEDIIADIMHLRAINVSTDTDQEEVARLLQELDLLAIPVVDKENRIIGIVTIDDAMDIMQDETTDDIFDHVGLVDVAGTECDRSELLVSGKMWRIWRVRMPFLIITMLAGFAAATIMQGFEDALSISMAVAFFIPLIMDMGGNVGTQSSTVFARGVVLGHITMDKFLKHLLKESGIGLSMGLLAGISGGLLAGIWHYPELGFAVGISLVVTMTLAATLGFLVPFVLIKVNADQAAGSAPIITSIKDIAGLFIYFTMVNLLMGHML